MGNCNPLTGNSLDEYVAKAIELGCPSKLIPLFKNHRPLMYYPDPKLVSQIIHFYNDKNYCYEKIPPGYSPGLWIFYYTSATKN